MELHQVRYFLALASTLNFTRAAEMCCVSQPALSRAIQALEYEMGGQLIARERQLSHLTELGHRLLPIFERTYQSAQTAKALAQTCSDGAALRLAMTATVDLGRLAEPLGKVIHKFPNIEVNVMRGSTEEILEFLKSGEADVAIADADLGNWDRLDSWLVERTAYSLVANQVHGFAAGQPASIDTIARERVICLPYCTMTSKFLEMGSHEGRKTCQVATLGDIFTLLQLNAGVALLPIDLELPDGLVRLETTEFPLEHGTHLYAVAGRLRSKSAGVFVAHFARLAIRNSVCSKPTAHLGRRAGKKLHSTEPPDISMVPRCCSFPGGAPHHRVGQAGVSIN